MKLTIKVGIAFAILCGLMALGGGFSYFNMGKINEAFTFVVKDISVLSDDANSIGQALLRINKTANDMVFTNTKSELEQGRQSFEAQAKALDNQLQTLLGRLAAIEQKGEAAQAAQSLQGSVKLVSQGGAEIYKTRTEILTEAALIDKIKTDFLTKISFAKVAVDLTFKSYADEDPYIGSLTKQMVSQIGTMEYMVNAIFSTQSLKEMQAIQRNAVSVSQMILKNGEVLQQEVPATKENGDFTAGLAALKENDGVKQGAIARYVALQDKRAQLLTQVQQVSDSVETAMKQVQSLQKASKAIGDVAFIKANDSISSTTMSIMMSLLFSLLFAGVVGWRLSSTINAPMTVLQRILRQLALGDFTQRVEGKFSGEFAELQRDINAVIQEFNNTLTVVKQGAQQTRDTANKNREFANTLAAQVQVQSGTMNTLAATVTEMEHAIQDVNSNTEASLGMVLSVDEQVQAGRYLVEENSRLIGSLFENLRHSEGVIQQVYVQSEHIGGILEVISGISEQTNLLALNAAIEAARAGEHGRGFAVVADEVRNLASRTNKSTQEINTMISELQNKSSGAVSSMQESLHLMQDGRAKMEQVNGSIGLIADHMLNVRNSAELIATATREQTIASREISRSINEMSEVVELSSKTMHDMAGQTIALDQLCEQQEKTVQQFKLGRAD
jgi:methyl-accepting chemotaxis protein